MNTHSPLEIVSKLEAFFRRVVSEEVERVIQKNSCPRPLLNQIESSGARAGHLHFENKLPSTLFTNSRIESEDNNPVKVVVLDASSKKIITSGPLSSMKIEIVVLDGDFDTDDEEDWTEKEFSAKIVREREGKRPLVIGDLLIMLRDGVGYVGDMSFTDNSSWIRSRKFRLGARVQRISAEVEIREAISEAFIVKDQRGESYKKHHPPSLGDEIWRLERIARDGAFHERLTSHGVVTVKDFLRLYVTDLASLRNILGSGISNKGWETIIEHATACVVDDDKLYMYKASERVGLVFNSIFKLVGVTFDGQNYQHVDKLNIFQMHFVEDLKLHAYKHLNDLVPIDDPSVVGCPVLLQAEPFGSSSVDRQNFNLPVAQDQHGMQLGSNHMTSPSYNYEVEDGSQVVVPMAQNSHQMQVFSPTLGNSFIMRDFFPGPYGEGCNWGGSGSVGRM